MTIESLAPPARPEPLAPNVRQHWIVDIARKAHLANSEALSIAPSASTEEAWAKTTEVCRIREDELTGLVALHFKLRVARLTAAESHALKLVPEVTAVDNAVATGKPFAFALIDFQMPDLDGFGLAEQIKNRPELGTPLIMMLSSLGHRGDGIRFC